MTIKNTLIGVMGAGLVAGSFSLSAEVAVKIDGQNFILPTDIKYNPIDPRRIVIGSQFDWVDLHPDSTCASDSNLAEMELYVQRPNGNDLRLVVDNVSYQPGTKTLEINTASGAGANCRTELLFWSRFEPNGFAPTPGS